MISHFNQNHLKTNLTDTEVLKIEWINKPKNMPGFIINGQREMITKLPIKHGKAKYMPESGGYFFSLTLENGLKLTITQYEEDIDEGAYVNFILNDKVVASDIMPIKAIITAASNYLPLSGSPSSHNRQLLALSDRSVSRHRYKQKP